MDKQITLDGKEADESLMLRKEEKDKCPACDGTGTVDCEVCDGSGEEECECDDCGDIHSRDCEECDGDGTYSCETCDGTGELWDEDD